MKLTPMMTLVLCLGMVCLTALVLHGDLPATVLTHLLTGVVGSLAPGGIQSIKESWHPPPYRPPPDDLR